MLRYTKIFLLVALFAAGSALTAAPGDKGGGKRGGDTVSNPEPPTTVFIEPQGRKQAPGLFIAGSDASNRQLIYQFQSKFTYLHDAVLVAEGHGRALVSDRTSDALPLILVDFTFDETGALVTKKSEILVPNRVNWGCETLSSNGLTAIYSSSSSGKVHEIDLESSVVDTWSFDPGDWFTDCDLNAESGILHVAVYESDTQDVRIDKIGPGPDDWETVVVVQPSDNIRSFAIASDGTVAVAQDSGIRIAPNFENFTNVGIAIPDGRMPDFFCGGNQLLLTEPSPKRRATTVCDLNTDSTEVYNQSAELEPQTLC